MHLAISGTITNDFILWHRQIDVVFMKCEKKRPGFSEVDDSHSLLLQNAEDAHQEGGLIQLLPHREDEVPIRERRRARLKEGYSCGRLRLRRHPEKVSSMFSLSLCKLLANFGWSVRNVAKC